MNGLFIVSHFLAEGAPRERVVRIAFDGYNGSIFLGDEETACIGAVIRADRCMGC